MPEAARETVLRGIAASAGLALGRIAIQRAVTACSGRLAPRRRSVRRSRRPWSPPPQQLEALAASAGDRAGADILEFQIALLDDEDLLAPIFERIARRRAAPMPRGARHRMRKSPYTGQATRSSRPV